MDLSHIKPSERVIEITHPATGKPIGVRVSLVSINDEKVKNTKRRIQDEHLALQRKNKAFKSTDLERNENAVIFAAMTSWDWYGEEVTFHGEKPVYNQKNVYAVLDEPGMGWFREQIQEALNEEQAFFQE